MNPWVVLFVIIVIIAIFWISTDGADAAVFAKALLSDIADAITNIIAFLRGITT